MEPVLYGRDETLGVLDAALEGALGGRGRLVLVSGEAGIGKSALATALARKAEARGALVTWGRAWEFADAPPYFPVVPCLRSIGLEVGGDPFELWERVALTLTASKKPTLWVLEDLHASDLGTLDLLAFLSQPLHSMPVLVLATARPNDPRLTERMQQRLTRIARDGTHLRLEKLGDVDVAALAERILGRAVSSKDLRKLVELTGGNPLFVLECAHAFRAAGGLEGTLAALPPTIRQVVLDRVEHLPRGTRDALSYGAILGREFTAALVGKMRGELPARVIDDVLAALRAGIVKELRPGLFVFSHALVRDAIEESLERPERARLHARAEAALATLPETADVLVERARHALVALEAENDGTALALVKRASDLLERGGAFDRAFELHVRVHEAQRDGLLPAATPADLLQFANIARQAGRSDVMRRVCDDAMDLARATNDAEAFARAILLHTSDVQPGVVISKEVALLEEARTRLGDRIPTLACRLLVRHATALQPHPDQERLMRMTRDALQAARATGDRETLLDVLELSWWGLYYAPVSERIAVHTELRDLALEANDIPKALLGTIALAFHHLECAEFEAFDAAVAEALALADEARHPRHRWRPLLLASMRALMLGHFAESERWVAEVEGLAALVDDAAFAPAMALHDVRRRRISAAEDEMREVLARAESFVTTFVEAPLYIALLRAGTRARAEDAAATREELARIGTRLEAICVDGSEMALAAEACALAGTEEQRRTLHRILSLTEARELHAGIGAFVYDGPTIRALGLLDAALGDRKQAEERLREAHRLAVQRKHRPWAAQIAWELSKLVGGAEAKQLREECVRIALDLGMTGLARRAGSTGEVKRPSKRFLLEKTGNLWKVADETREVTVKDSRGMQLLARLVERPDEEIHVLTLASDEATGMPETNAGEMLDERARVEYKQRLVDLEEDLAEATRNADTYRATKLEAEREALLAELSRAVGLGRRRRVAASATERARVNVQRRVKDAIARIGEADRELGRVFERAVRTGTFCCFRP